MHETLTLFMEHSLYMHGTLILCTKQAWDENITHGAGMKNEHYARNKNKALRLCMKHASDMNIMHEILTSCIKKGGGGQSNGYTSIVKRERFPCGAGF